MPEASADNQFKATADTIKATVEAIQAMESLVEDAARSVIIEVNNTSSRTMFLHSVNSLHGEVVEPLPPDSIGPRSTHLFAARSSAGAFFTGTQGSVTYRIADGSPPPPNDVNPEFGDGSSFNMKWNNPFIGSNDFRCFVFRGTPEWYATRSITGGGNKAAKMRAILGEHADFGPHQSDWLPCGECKALFFSLDESSKCPSNKFDTGIKDQQGHHLFRFAKHKIAGSAFRLSHSIPGANRLPGWRKCTNCKALFWDRDPDKGVCVGAPFVEGVQNIFNGHAGEGPIFHLAFDMPLRPGQQNDWRFCTKCFEVFFLPQNADAECAAGGQHHARPENYVLDLA